VVQIPLCVVVILVVLLIVVLISRVPERLMPCIGHLLLLSCLSGMRIDHVTDDRKFNSWLKHMYFLLKPVQG